MGAIKGKHIVVGITGSIAAYKACTLIRLLIKAGAEVQVVITPSGKEFISPLTLSTLTNKPVVSDFFDRRDGSWHSHVSLGLWADAMVISPATASTIGKMANGIADNMLITTYLSMKAPVFIAPAMDLDMYNHPSTQQNLQKLRSYGNFIIEATNGELASHLVGKGRMEEPERIFEILNDYFNKKCFSTEYQDLKGKKILITAGPTQEKIDAVRYISNYSTGKMGFALAEVCAEKGAEVELVCGPVTLSTQNPRIHRTNVVSASEMYETVLSLFPSMNAVILCAAVADFTCVNPHKEKIKREKNETFSLTLCPTRDIAAELGKKKKGYQRLVGFALETNNELKNAEEKIKSKNLDFIVLNSLRDEGAGFAFDTNKITIINSDGTSQIFPLKEKRLVAFDIVNHLAKLFE